MVKKYLSHHGIKGQKWGVRRYQNNDGSLTAQGRRKYNVNDDGTTQMKKSYKNKQRAIGAVKTLVGTSVVLRGGLGISNAKRANLGTRSNRRFLQTGNINRSVTNMLIGSIVVGAGVKNFINSVKDQTFNSTGMGATPEYFEGKPKTRKQVIAQEKRNKGK